MSTAGFDLGETGVRLADALVPEPAPVQLPDELRAEVNNRIEHAEPLGVGSGLRLDVEAMLQLTLRLQLGRQVGPGSHGHQRVDRIRDHHRLLERLNPALDIHSRPGSPHRAGGPDRQQNECAQVFQPEILGHRQGVFRMLLPRGFPERGGAVCELREHEGLRP